MTLVPLPHPPHTPSIPVDKGAKCGPYIRAGGRSRVRGRVVMYGRRHGASTRRGQHGKWMVCAEEHRKVVVVLDDGNARRL